MQPVPVVVLEAVTVVGFATAPAAGENVGVAAVAVLNEDVMNSGFCPMQGSANNKRSEEHTSELQSHA